MKKLLILICLFGFFSVHAQVSVDNTISTWKKLGYHSIEFKSENGAKYLPFLYHNMEYSSIDDIGGFTFRDSATAHAFTKNLSDIIQYAGKKDAHAESSQYTINTFSNNTFIYIYDTNHKYTYFTKKTLQSLIDWINSLDWK